MNFKTGFIALALMGLASVVAVGCGGSVCDDAADICGAPEDGSSEDGAEAECTGQVECIAQCIVDNNTCDFTNADLIECGSAC